MPQLLLKQKNQQEGWAAGFGRYVTARRDSKRHGWPTPLGLETTCDASMRCTLPLIPTRQELSTIHAEGNPYK